MKHLVRINSPSGPLTSKGRLRLSTCRDVSSLKLSQMTVLFPHAKAREDLAQEVICRELACNRAEFILGKTEFLCEKLSARCRFASAPERFGNALQSGEVALPRH